MLRTKEGARGNTGVHNKEEHDEYFSRSVIFLCVKDLSILKE